MKAKLYDTLRSAFKDPNDDLSASVLQMAIQALDDAPEYFWTAPASSSGKFHPDYANGAGGLVCHTIMAMRVLESLLEGPLHGMFDRYSVEDMFVALALHDCWKLDAEGKTAFLHPRTAAENVAAIAGRMNKSTATYAVRVNRICGIIASHMGRWNKSRHSTEALPIPITSAEKAVHAADYIASRKWTCMAEYDDKEFELDRLERKESAFYNAAIVAALITVLVGAASYVAVDSMSIGAIVASVAAMGLGLITTFGLGLAVSIVNMKRRREMEE